MKRCVGIKSFSDAKWLKKTSRRQNKKFFDPTIFQKCWRGVGEQPTFAEQIKLHKTSQQKLKRESRCAPALPNRIQVVSLEARFPIPSRRQIKSFSMQQFFKNAAEVQGE
ncbi:MAG: hypothetical protein UGF38_05830 [Ruminococcus sp.]|nr:hypothetical protein [Ruminococcus sp.]